MMYADFVVVSNNYQIKRTEEVIYINHSANAVSVYLPPAKSGKSRMLYIRSITPTSLFTVTLVPANAEEMDDGIDPLNPGSGRVFHSDGHKWRVLSEIWFS